MQITPYLTFNGQCADAFRFYETCLGGTIAAMMKFGETPAAADTPPDWHGKVIHAVLQVGENMLMGTDAPPDRFEASKGFSVTLCIEDPAEAERVFYALADGGSVGMPIGETFWATRFGMLVDRFGIPWMINCAKPASAQAA